MNIVGKTKIIFLKVADNSAKLQAVCSLTAKHLESKEALLIATHTTEATNYIDQLLWKMPEESFIPHSVANAPCRELVAITHSAINVNDAKILINLRPEPVQNPGRFSLIYELLDLTHPMKQEQSRARQASYRQSGFLVEEI